MSETNTNSRRQPTILCVDDEPTIISSLKRVLRREDAIVLTALSGEEALEILKRENVDLLITDMRMPGLTGADLLAEVKRLELDPARILLTGYTDDDLLKDAINEGGLDRYLRKPWVNEELLSAVRQELDRHALRLENRELNAELAQKNEALLKLNEGLEETVQERTAELQSSNHRLERSLTDLRESHRATARIFYNLLSLSEHLGGDQAILTGKLTALIAQQLGLNKELIGQIRLAGILGELGLLCMDSTLHSRPWYELSEEERQRYITHPNYATQAMAPATHLSTASNAIKHQFERFDGKGLPDKLQGDQIPMTARILAVSRDYVRALNGVLQKGRLSSFSAYKEIERASGYIYDPDVVAALQLVLPKLNEEVVEKDEAVLSTAKLQSGMTLSRDLFNNRSILLLPKGKVLTDSMINKLQQIEEADESFLDVYVYRKK
ncbi:MAG TPA: HD domain-containing phosphohydrolase [Marinobacterium sp.]|nr:HD domain-containing phosphohydrolase [Marinobacterium sp.]